MSNLYPQGQNYQNLLNQYIYGAPGAQAGAPAQGPQVEQIISGYQQQREGAARTEEYLAKTEKEIVRETLKPVMEKVAAHRKMSLKEYMGTDKEEMLGLVKEASQQLQDLAGMSKIHADSLAYRTSGAGLMEWVMERVKAGEKLPPGKDVFDFGAIKAEDLGYDSSAARWDSPKKTQEFNEFMEYQPKYDIQEMYNQLQEAPEAEKPTMMPEASMAPAVQAGEDASMSGGLLAQIADPAYISEQFGLAKKAGMEEIGDWYTRAARELEQRGISQYGGLMGSQYERDVGGVLGKRGEMESTLGRELRTAQIGMERQNLYDVLNAMTNLQTLQSNLQTARTSPWIGAAQSLASAPYGQTTTTPYQGVGMIPAAISGAYAGLGLYGMGQNLGLWGQGQDNQPATSYGAGTSGLNLAGTQNLYNQYTGSNLWN